jgi:hypothetical protein
MIFLFFIFFLSLSFLPTNGNDPAELDSGGANAADSPTLRVVAA